VRECVRFVTADNLNPSVSYHSDKPHVGNDVIWPIWRDFVFKINGYEWWLKKLVPAGKDAKDLAQPSCITLRSSEIPTDPLSAIP
jgi:hypothetical protein